MREGGDEVGVSKNQRERRQRRKPEADLERGHQKTREQRNQVQVERDH